MTRSASRTCPLCGHPENVQRCGNGLVRIGAGELWLCRGPDHDCYFRWTEMGHRPPAAPPPAPPMPGPVRSFRPLGQPLWTIDGTVFDTCPHCGHPGPHPAAKEDGQTILRCDTDGHVWAYRAAR